MIENKDYFIGKWKGESEDVLKKYKAKQFIKVIENAEILEEFDMDLFFKIVEKMTVFGGERIIVSLLDGTEIEVVINY
jgi:site-specific DNA recombinase